MLLAAISLFSLQIVGTLAAPFYLKIRGHMSSGNFHKYSKKRIIKDILLHFSMMSFITAHFVVILFAFLHSNAVVTQSLLFYMSLEVALLAAGVYGSGMYIASVLFETTTKKQFPINRLVHGPISHGIMYGAYLAAFGNLSNIISQTDIQNSPVQPLLYLVIGLLGGYSAGISAIGSGIASLYALLSLAIGIIFAINNLDLQNPFFLHFLGFSGSSFLICLLFSVLSKRKYKKTIWYQPVDFSKIKI